MWWKGKLGQKGAFISVNPGSSFQIPYFSGGFWSVSGEKRSLRDMPNFQLFPLMAAIVICMSSTDLAQSDQTCSWVLRLYGGDGCTRDLQVDC